ncbi:nucleotide exchange factor GrpE [Magnetospirillum gryphiswaldense]|uniref:Protein GrpE n=2 Tax=Magnetospirillum gryphiswaldense TaxID=55518 RepID=V6F3U4_MAGGM|nr:nucleotide exchange factor GrpE [Magnetospirillum gryphiswaldense]AVM75914.1 heat shock protein GrpE [Magnetospirillum gryphiswaldense MSR-1]AVM79817.1 heat shock protein GrpE [Magnetospirillum gryphiswaldense]CAM74234.1 GrpE protein [Magnetospirillum gryphiswaldense MSR-1]CDL00119.1 Protein grpE (HSP-70 cofactor),heat shock protein [Magnetospirillum gryphiswaldense MSR-1 v2]
MSEEQTTEQSAEAPAPETPAPAEVVAPEARIAELEAEVAKLKSEVLYARADTENVRRRLEQQAEDRGKFAVSNFAKDVLSVADNLRRALDAVPPTAREGNDIANTLTVGVELTEREMLAALERYGIRQIQALGQRFDPNLHQAMMEMEDASQPEGTVVMVMQQGYQLHERLLRPALVAVAKGGPKTPPGEQVDTSA